MGESVFVIAGPNGWKVLGRDLAEDYITDVMDTEGVSTANINGGETELVNFLDEASLGHVLHNAHIDVYIVCISPDSARKTGFYQG
jgi:hypothetical protein